MQNEINPAVSVIIPVYNAEEYLRRGLESVLYQTLENIEVICVNKGSTDSSLEILNEYKKQFPDKLFVYDIGYTSTPSEGRAYGVEKAHGEYIYHCDADDMVRFTALESLYEKATRDKCDMVLGYNEIIFSTGETRVQGRVKGKSILSRQEAMLLNGAYWVRLIKRSLIDKVGNVPVNMYCDDFAYIPVITSFADKIGYVDTLTYYYYRKAESVMCTPKLDVVEGSIKAEKWILEHVNETEISAAELVIAQHILVNLKSRWRFNDRTVMWLREFMGDLSQNSLVYRDAALYKELLNWNTGATGNIPKILYVNGFEKDFNPEKSKQRLENAFYDDFKVIILDENNCNVKSHDWCAEALKAKRYDFLGKYFAIQKIYESGGIYVGSKIIIDNPLNYVTYLHAFFGYLDRHNLIDELWGAEAENPVIEAVLQTYEEDCDSEFSLADRIKNILAVEYDLILNGRSTLFKYPFTLFSPDIVTASTTNDESVDSSRVRLSHLTFGIDLSEKEYCILKKSTLEYLTPVNESQYQKMKIQCQNEKRLKSELNKAKNGKYYVNTKDIRYLFDEQRQYFNQIETERIKSITCEKDMLEQRLHMLENSFSWKITRPLRAVRWWMWKRAHKEV